jgi:hypothetical protein
MTGAVLCATLSLAGAGVIHVPGDSATVQKGLNGALPGDTVLVAPGTYYEQLSWPAREGIVLQSEAGAESTAIDGSGAGRVLTMNALDYTRATQVRGFRITHGLVTVYPGNGAGVWCRGAPVFEHDWIVHNLNFTMGYGGGVYATGAPRFLSNLIAWDTVWNPGGGGWRYGGGIYCQGPGVFCQNVFLENAAYDTNAGGFWYGGGLCLQGSGTVFNNLFVRNSCGATTGGFAYGGALYVSYDSGLVANNTFFANRCSSAIPYGGGIYADCSPTVVIKNNIVVGNSARGIAPFGGGIAATWDTLDTLALDYNDVQGNAPADYYWCRPGPHSLALDPLFAAGPNGDYYLSQIAAGQDSTSPCVDAGDTLLPTAELNLDSLIHAGTTRTDSFPDDGAIDLGYHYPMQMLAALRENRAVPRARELNLAAWPNPFRNSVQFQIPKDAGIDQLQVRDVLGRTVARLPVRDGRCRWDGRSDAGVYFASAGSVRVKLIRE